MRASVLATIGFAAYLGAFGFSFIDNAAHLGGLAAGALIAWLTVRREDEEPRHSSGGQPQWNLIGAAAAVLIVVGAGGTVAALARARPRPVSSAEVSLSSASVGDRAQTAGRSMVVTNKSDRPIEAYRVSVRRDGRGFRAFWRDDCCFTGNGALAPIAPHESREIGTMPVVVGVGLAPPAPHLDVVIFADGSYEGDPDQYQELIAQRQWAADAADFWITALKEDRWLQPKAFAVSLTTRLENRLKQSPLEYAAATALGIPALIADDPPSSQQGRVDESLAAIAAAQKALRARLAAR